MTVKAMDEDEGENGKVTYHLKLDDINVQETAEFVINPDNGELRTKVFLDREVRARYDVSNFINTYKQIRIRAVVKVGNNEVNAG